MLLGGKSRNWVTVANGDTEKHEVADETPDEQPEGECAPARSHGGETDGDDTDHGYTLHRSAVPHRPRPVGIAEEHCFERAHAETPRDGDDWIEQSAGGVRPDRYSGEECKRHEREHPIAATFVHAGSTHRSG